MHWILFGVCTIAFAGAWFAPNQALIVVGILVGFAALFGGFIAMISARIAERARPDAALLTDADVNALRKSVREARLAREAAAAARQEKA